MVRRRTRRDGQKDVVTTWRQDYRGVLQTKGEQVTIPQLGARDRGLPHAKDSKTTKGQPSVFLRVLRTLCVRQKSSPT